MALRVKLRSLFLLRGIKRPMRRSLNKRMNDPVSQDLETKGEYHEK